ncbi:hypothetical protein K443DRAFT_397168 [Laccaria amethystina LaAM-08-1]|uniref:Uncharacterized protein n=1 Tax=Laccaria amethystina LaAM-08-1 TaxID=1095629 RepID=A0A0C9WX97_9AGAR|nr:hypothetical protein K443DRAFT_397168 [Laccaria amethystina LaAM-08-1]
MIVAEGQWVTSLIVPSEWLATFKGRSCSDSTLTVTIALSSSGETPTTSNLHHFYLRLPQWIASRQLKHSSSLISLTMTPIQMAQYRSIHLLSTSNEQADTLHMDFA